MTVRWMLQKIVDIGRVIQELEEEDLEYALFDNIEIDSDDLDQESEIVEDLSHDSGPEMEIQNLQNNLNISMSDENETNIDETFRFFICKKG